MSIMPILVPFVVLATGFATIMFLLYRNLWVRLGARSARCGRSPAWPRPWG